jgi:cytochrome c peroxidase
MRNSERIRAAILLSASAMAGLFAAPPPPARSDAKYDRETAKAVYRRPDTIPFPANNTYSRARAELGKVLFFDPRLSSSGEISCASCHRPQYAWSDSAATSAGVPGTPLKRRSPTILNGAWADSLFWDGRAASLEEQALGPIQADAEMNMPMEKALGTLKKIAAYAALFDKAYPGEGIVPETIGKAIATFERTVVSGTAPFDEWIMGDESAIGDSAKRGFDVFNTKALCAKCHSGWNFTDGSFHDLGFNTEDRGRGRLLPQIEAAQFGFKTMTLRNIAQRAPYFHDGSVRTLEEVVNHYDKGPWQQRPSLAEELHKLELTDTEKRDLVEFMKTLTGDDEPISLPVLPN